MYRNTRTSLRGESTKLINSLTVIMVDLALFEDQVLNMLDTVKLVKITTKVDVLTRKVKILDTYLDKLQLLINKVASLEEKLGDEYSTSKATGLVGELGEATSGF